MAIQSNLPKWATPERQDYLLQLWALYGNKCLRGHTACPEPSHYVQDYPELIEIGKTVKLPCTDRNGNPLKDTDGNQLYLSLIQPVPEVIHHLKNVRLYDVKAEDTIESWKAEDRTNDHDAWIATQKAIHSLGERRYPLRGQFSAISRDIFADAQPLYYIEALGMNGLKLEPFAKVRISSTYLSLYVDLGNILKKSESHLSKHKRRKYIRYGKPIPFTVEAKVSHAVREVVKDYYSH